DQVSTPVVSEPEISVVKPSLDEQHIEHEQTTTTGLLDKLKTFLPSSLASPKTEHITSEELSVALEQDQAAVPSSLTETTLTTASEENLIKPTEPVVEKPETMVISSPVSDYFTSSDVYHAYKQPVEPIIKEEPVSSGLIETATTIVTNIISDLTSALTTPEATEDSTSTIKSTVVHDQVSTPVVSEPEISVVKPSLDEQHIEHEQTTTTGLLDKLKT
ncbi:unnamed protein product, partial [Rotaria sp. Silwood1]